MAQLMNDKDDDDPYYEFDIFIDQEIPGSAKYKEANNELNEYILFWPYRFFRFGGIEDRHQLIFSSWRVGDFHGEGISFCSQQSKRLVWNKPKAVCIFLWGVALLDPG